MRKNKDTAVSPVIGVMLMLVITIIIAAVVSFSATGFLGSASTSGGSADLKFVGFYTGGYTLGEGYPNTATIGEGGMVFEVTGNTPLDVTNLRLSGSGSVGGGGSFAVSYNTPVALDWISPTEGGTASPSKLRSRLTQPTSSIDHRIVKFGEGWRNEEKYNTIVQPGERFVVLAEYILGNPSSYTIGFAARNTDGSTAISGAISSDGNSLITLMDMKTGKVYYSGALTNDQAI
ncbi:MAG: type IV pilin N-terminal domain-containing protein [Methanocorpusculum sp.]|nr:type IV pilin N-terminal domain-containing protein [Methanocorpusculum sp.]MDE2521680.1 type IV pilin N-terminal domain-containing protein [Methanocorpusculum sp.]MDE2524764.1 type IV pilin N-terminal domain-containing protein [Methanocorpusculum sp.]